mgnify:FL=1
MWAGFGVVGLASLAQTKAAVGLRNARRWTLCVRERGRQVIDLTWVSEVNFMISKDLGEKRPEA